MKKIANPYVERENYNCFGCSPKNSIGLQMEFYEDGDEVICNWKTDNRFQGYINVLHGGIQSVLMDEIASWVVFVKLKTSGVTSKLEIKYKKPVFTDGNEITLKAKIHRIVRNVAEITVCLINQNGEVCSEGIVTYYTFSQEEARKKMLYPEYEKFFENK